MKNTILHGDCLEKLRELEANSVDLVLSDPPYGTTSCPWDTEVDLVKMWEEVLRVAKDDAAIIFTANQPFTSKLVMSKPELFRHEWIYKKRCASNFAQASLAPMKEHESVLVFSKKKARYFPIMEERTGGGASRVKYNFSEATRHKSGEFVGTMAGSFESHAKEKRYPSSVREFNNRAAGDRGLHPTQKPLALMKYLVETYSREGELVLDPFAGSGTTCVAAQELKRNYIGIEREEEYANICKARLLVKQPTLLTS